MDYLYVRILHMKNLDVLIKKSITLLYETIVGQALAGLY